MTTSTSLSGASLAPKPPAKGSFPLDHLAECKQFAIAYETCLKEHNHTTSQCRKEAREYLQCRMERGLMAQERWDKLGLDKEKVGGSIDKAKLEERVEAGGFVAGARSAKRRKEKYGKTEKGE